MSLRLKLPLHGRSHLPNGSDPIPAQQIGSSYALFTAQEMADGVTKTLVPGQPGYIIIPLDWFVVASTDYSPTGGQPDLNLETPSWTWDFHTINSFGVTYYNTGTIMTGAPADDSVPASITGDELRVTSVGNGATTGVGHVEVFVHYERVRVSP